MSTDVASAAGPIPSFENYSGTAPDNYERYFVPAIGAPLAAELVDVAALRPGERVLDVACGTGIVTRFAAERVGADGAVAGVDINPGMLGVARSAARPELGIDWHEASAEALPFEDETFDVVLCQMGLQFFPGQARRPAPGAPRAGASGSPRAERPGTDPADLRHPRRRPGTSREA